MRTLVSAHSNKGMQVLAERTLQLLPDAPMILVGVEKKIPEQLKPISLTSWYQMIATNFIEIQNLIEYLSSSKKKPTTQLIQLNLKLINEKLNFIKKQLEKFNFFDANKESYGFSKNNFIKLYDINVSNFKNYLSKISAWVDLWESKEKLDVEAHLLVLPQ